MLLSPLKNLFQVKCASRVYTIHCIFAGKTTEKQFCLTEKLAPDGLETLKLSCGMRSIIVLSMHFIQGCSRFSLMKMKTSLPIVYNVKVRKKGRVEDTQLHHIHLMISQLTLKSTVQLPAKKTCILASLKKYATTKQQFLWLKKGEAGE